MATGEPFGYGLLRGLTYTTQTTTNALQQALGAANVSGTAYMNYNYMADQWAITTNPYGQVAVQAQPERKPVKCEGCGAGSGEAHYSDCEVLNDRCACHTGRASKVHSATWRLRKEIDDWHGDVLERLAA